MHETEYRPCEHIARTACRHTRVPFCREEDISIRVNDDRLLTLDDKNPLISLCCLTRKVHEIGTQLLDGDGEQACHLAKVRCEDGNLREFFEFFCMAAEGIDRICIQDEWALCSLCNTSDECRRIFIAAKARTDEKSVIAIDNLRQLIARLVSAEQSALFILDGKRHDFRYFFFYDSI